MGTSSRPSYWRGPLIAATLLTSFCVHLYLSLQPDSAGDPRIFSFWAYQLERFGIAGVYFARSPYPVDYPPGFLYVLRLLVWLRGIVDTSPLGPAADMQYWIRVTYSIADLITAWVVYLGVRRVASWRTAYLALVCYAFNPAVICAGAYMGLSDTMNVLPTVVALVLLDYKKPELSWVAISVGVLTKQFAAPISLVIAVVTFRQYGWRRTLGCAAASLATSILMLSPLLMEIAPLVAIERALFDFSNMSYITINAHNLWWLTTGGPPWTSAAKELLGPLSYQTAGTTLFCLLWAGCLAALWWKKRDFQSRYTLAALITCGFFMFVTHMHEVHLFTSVAILAVVAFRERWIAGIYLLMSATLLANVLLHDPYLVTEVLYGMPFEQRDLMSFTWTPGSQPMSPAHLWMTFVNAGLNVLIFGALAYFTLRTMRQAPPPPQDPEAERVSAV